MTSQTPPKPTWKDPYYPSCGHSPLRKEYKLVDTANEDDNTTASDTAVHNNLPVSHPLGAMYSPGPTNSMSAATHNLLAVHQEDPEDYDPEYATYLTAAMQYQPDEEEMAHRKEYEDFYRIQKVLDRKQDWNESLALWLSERRLRDEIEMYFRGEASVRRGSESGWDMEWRVGKGTGGAEGHKRMREFLEGGGMKRKRDREDEGEVGGLGKKVMK